MDDYIYGNDPSDCIHMTEDPHYVEGQEEESDLHEPAINKNYIVTDETDQDHDLPVPLVNQFICKPIIRASNIISSDRDPSNSDFNESDASMTSLQGQCWNCESMGPLGLYCSTCMDTGFIYETIPKASSCESRNSRSDTSFFMADVQYEGGAPI